MIINGDGEYGLLVAYIGGRAAQADWLGPKVGGHLAAYLYSSREPSELLQWLCYDSTIVEVIIIIRPIINNHHHYPGRTMGAILGILGPVDDGQKLTMNITEVDRTS